MYVAVADVTSQKIGCHPLGAESSRHVGKVLGGWLFGDVTMDKSFKEKFWARVDKQRPGGCWEWTASLNTRGYGQISRGGKMLQAHRLSWEMTNHRPIPNGMYVLHMCDNPRCVRPSHLWIGTQKDNVRDMEDKGRAVHPKGVDHWCSKLTEEDVREIRDSTQTNTKLAKIFRVNHAQISRVRSRKTWTHVKDTP